MTPQELEALKHGTLVKKDPLDGDKILAFIQSVELMSEALKTVNILGIADLFVKNRQEKGIEDAITLAKSWNKGLIDLENYTNTSRTHLMAMNKATNQHADAMKNMCDIMMSSRLKESIAKMREVNEVAEQFRKNTDTLLILMSVFMPDKKPTEEKL